MLTQYFYHKITGLPLTDPLVTASVTLANMNSDTKVLDNAPMTASVSFPGAFRNTYSPNAEIDYMAYYSCSDSNYIPSVDKVYIPKSPNGIGIISNAGSKYDFGATDRKNIEDIIKWNTELQDKLNGIYSHIDIAKGEIIGTIEGIEIPEVILEEKEAKKAVKLLTTFIPKVTGYIDSEMKEKDETSAIVRELNKLDIEDEMKMKEKKQKEEEEKKMEAEEQKKEEERIAEILNAEFDKLDQQEQEDKRKELEKELEEAKKEVIEIETELKSL